MIHDKNSTWEPPFLWRVFTGLFTFLFSLLSIVLVAAVVWWAHNNLSFPNNCKVMRSENNGYSVGLSGHPGHLGGEGAGGEGYQSGGPAV